MISLRKQRPKGMPRMRTALVGLACVCATLMLWPGQASAASWQPATDLSASGQNARTPQLALDGSGNAVAVWVRFNGTHSIVQSASRPAGGVWQPAQNASALGGHASDPQVVFDAAGNALAVWTRSNGTNEIVQAAWRPVGGSWQAADNLSAVGQDAAYPQVAVNGAGTAVVVWERWNGTNVIVQGALRPTAGPWQVAQDLSPAGGNASNAQVALSGAGDAVAVWSHQILADTTVQGAKRPAGGAWRCCAGPVGAELEQRQRAGRAGLRRKRARRVGALE